MAHRKELDWETMVAKYTAIKLEFTRLDELRKRRVDKQALASVDTILTATPKTTPPCSWEVEIEDACGNKDEY